MLLSSLSEMLKVYCVVSSLQTTMPNLFFPAAVDLVLEVTPPSTKKKNLQVAWGAVGHLNGVRNNSEMRKEYEAVQPLVVRALTRYGQSEPLYGAYKRLLERCVLCGKLYVLGCIGPVHLRFALGGKFKNYIFIYIYSGAQKPRSGSAH